MSAKDIIGLWCDDITFCLEECERMDCPRNQHNIRDRRVPHSYSLEIPQDCPKNEEELSSSKRKENESMYECFHCGQRSVIWGADFNLEDYGYEGEGIIHSCHCANCGAEILYIIRLDQEEDGAETDDT